MRPADRILTLLYDRPHAPWSVDELAAAAPLGRGAVTAALEALRRAGHRLESFPSQGVRLLRPARPAAVLIERDLPVRRVGRSVVCFDEVDSTNAVALGAMRQADADGLAVLAESQRRGRGRHGRRWVSPPGRNVLLSVLLVAPGGGGGVRHDALTIATGVAVAEAIAESAGLSCGLKWPNDVLLEGAKVAGVLVETRRDREAVGMVLGVGINANASPPADAVDRSAACLADALGAPVERVELVRSLLVRLDGWVERLSSGAGAGGLHEAFVSRCRMLNTRARIACDGREYVGRVLDVDPLAGLVLACDDGATVRLPAARSTVRSGGAA